MSELKHITDFSDKLNPMLVKELRQGLRGIGFVILFMGLQVMLALILMIGASAASYDNAGHILSRTIFFFFTFAVVIVQPLRGVSALSSEIKGDTIDLLCLTRLSAWRMTYGKWISLVSQSALLLTSIIPYLILRYFFGDMQLFSEILFLLSIFILSATLTAFTVGFSGLKSNLFRVLFPILGAVIAFSSIFRFFVTGRSSFQETVNFFSLDSSSSLIKFLTFIFMCLYTGWMSLDLGATQIAPIAENRATLKRFISLVFIFLLLMIGTLLRMDPSSLLLFGCLLSIPICLISLTENPQLVSPIAAPFVKRKLFGKLLGRLLYPGWATGLIYAALLLALLQGFYLYHQAVSASADHLDSFIIPSIFASLFLPVALTRFLAQGKLNRFGLFLLFFSLQFLLIVIIYMIEEWATDLNIMPFFCWIPSVLFALNSNTVFPQEMLSNVAWINAVTYLVIALATSIPVWKHIKETEGSVSPPKEV